MIDPAAVAARLWPTSDTLFVEASTAGGNNRLFCISAGAERRALKFYPSADGSLRLHRERSALTWLQRDAALATIPTFHAADPEAPAALIGWIDGAAVRDPQIRDIDAALAFVDRLLLRQHEAHELPMAAEATPTGEALAAQIYMRLARRRTPAADAIAKAVADAFMKLGPVRTAPARTLIASPSDFGFHNVLRLPDGDLAFLDFEYFGQDDPVRLVGDFILHPGSWTAGSDPAACPLRRRFMDGLSPRLNALDSDFASRLRRHLPYLALRWALIVLNPLAPERPPLSPEAAEAQLRKADALLAFAVGIS